MVPVGAGSGGTLTLFGKTSVLAGFTASVYVWLPVRPEVLLSLAVIVKVEVPETVGVPLSTPVVVFSDNPDGTLPEATANV
jgi:hypothetical protein